MSTDAVETPKPKPNRTANWIAMLVGLPLAGYTWMQLTGSMQLPHRSGSFSAGAVLLLLIVCTITDLRKMKIYNWATATGFLTGLGFHTFTTFVNLNENADSEGLNLGNLTIFESITGSLLCFFAVFIVYQGSGLRGAGDVKLSMALGAWLGLQEGMLAILYTYAAAGIILSQWVIWDVGPFTLLKHVYRWALALLRPAMFSPPPKLNLPQLKRPVPMGVFFLIGTMIALSGVIIR
jgi:prepilin peptidase CpaA